MVASMKIVMISSVPAFPTTQGNRSRIRAMAEQLVALDHEFHLVLLPADRKGYDLDAHRAAFDHPDGQRVHLVSNGGRLAHRLFRLRRSLRKAWRKPLRRMGLDIGFYSPLELLWNHRWDDQLRALCADADAVIVAYAINSYALTLCPEDTRRILDTHDVFADRHRAFREQGMPGKYWISLKPEQELRAFRRADSVLAIQGEEAEEISHRLASEEAPDQPDVAVVSHLLDTGNRLTDFRTDDAALFVGSDNPANLQAVETFISETLPLIRRRRPDFRLHLAGSVCKKVADHPGVARHGFVDDLSEAYLQAPISLNPMLVGTGINIKLLEAMATGVPIVSSQTGLRGLPEPQHGGIISLPDGDHAGFAEAVCTLAGDAGKRRALGRQAHAAAQLWADQQIEALFTEVSGGAAGARWTTPASAQQAL